MATIKASNVPVRLAESIAVDCGNEHHNQPCHPNDVNEMEIEIQ